MARLALSLFDQTRDIHGLGDREREWLEYAALLHDVGSHISYEGHHKHAYYIITNGGLRGFEPEEIELMALVARYHRSGKPKKSNPEFSALRKPLRSAVRTLAALLAVAESLDRSHAQVVAAIDLDHRTDHDVLRVRTTSDAELELWALNRHLGALERVVGKVVRVESLSITQALPVVGACRRRRRMASQRRRSRGRGHHALPPGCARPRRSSRRPRPRRPPPSSSRSAACSPTGAWNVHASNRLRATATQKTRVVCARITAVGVRRSCRWSPPSASFDTSRKNSNNSRHGCSSWAALPKSVSG